MLHFESPSSQEGLLCRGPRHSDHRGGSLDLHRLGHGLLGSGLLGLLFVGESLEELCPGGFIIECAGLHPGVGSDLLDCGASIAIEGEEAKDEVLEVIAEVSAVHLLEVGVILALENQVVEVLFFAGLLEGEDALDNDEEDDSNGEHVDLLAGVLLALLNFWRHVGHCATVRLQSVNILVAGEAKVGQLEVQVVIDEDVLKFEVSVDDSA